MIFLGTEILAVNTIVRFFFRDFMNSDSNALIITFLFFSVLSHGSNAMFFFHKDNI